LIIENISSTKINIITKLLGGLIMLQTVTFRMRNLIAVLTLILIAGSAAMAQAPSTPRNLRAMADRGIEGVILSWNLERNSDNPAGFYVFMAEGDTEDIDDFTLYEDMVVSDDNENLMNQGGYWAAFLEMELEEDQEITFYIIAYNDDGESDPSNFAKLRNQNNYPRAYMYFTNEIDEEDMYAAIGEEWIFDADAEVIDTDNTVYTDGITYSIIEASIDDININSETGEVSFTPDESGYVHFVIEAVWDEDERVRGHMQIAVMVRACEIPAVISGTVYDEDGDPVTNEVIHVMNADMENPNNQGYYMAWIEDGEFSVEVDAGSYILLFEGRNYITEFYEDASDPEDATVIEVDCEEEYSVEMVVTSLDDLDYYTVTGNVSYDDGDPIEGALIEFRSIDSNRWLSIFNAITDENGDYEIEVPDIYSYIAVAYNIELVYGGGRDSMFCRHPLYYDQTYDPREATEIEITGDLDGIDFVFDNEDYEFNNEISGVVINEQEEFIENCYIVAFNTDTDYYFYRNTFPSQTNSDGEFLLENLVPGSYVLLAFPGRSDYAPGFYVEDDIITWTWEEATLIEIDEDETVSDIVITLPLMEDMGGICELRGMIRQRRGEIKGGDSPLSGEALSGASVYLATYDGTPVKYTSTNEQGQFEFVNVKEGEYVLKVDKIGYENYQVPVELSYGESKDLDEIDMIEEGTSSVDDNNTANASVYPNPANGIFNLTYEAAASVSRITITNAAGMQIFSSEENTMQGFNTFNYDVKNLTNGTYFIKVQSGSNVSVITLVVIH
jgi:hypothetical protein